MKKTCEICHGTGQLSSFRGVSRFLLSWEECPQCSGLGYTITGGASEEDQRKSKSTGEKGQPKKTPKRRKSGK